MYSAGGPATMGEYSWVSMEIGAETVQAMVVAKHNVASNLVKRTWNRGKVFRVFRLKFEKWIITVMAGESKHAQVLA